MRLSPSSRLDLAGMGLAAVLAAALVRAGGDEADLAAALAVVGMAVGAYAVGRSLGRELAFVAALLVAFVALLSILEPATLSGRASALPLGYANANAAFYVLVGTVTALTAVTAGPNALRRNLALAATGLMAALCLPARALAGLLAALLVLLAALAAVRGMAPAWRRLWAVGCLVVVTVVAATVGLGLASSGPPERALDPAAMVLSANRLNLWGEALTLLREQPWSGVGVGGFAEQSPTARSDPDLRYAHSAVLQVGAEAGVLGAIALLLLLLWGIARPWAGARAKGASPALVGSAAATGLGLMSAVDYVLSYPVVAAGGAFVVGLATAKVGDASREERTTVRRATPGRL